MKLHVNLALAAILITTPAFADTDLWLSCSETAIDHGLTLEIGPRTTRSGVRVLEAYLHQVTFDSVEPVMEFTEGVSLTERTDTLVPTVESKGGSSASGDRFQMTVTDLKHEGHYDGTLSYSVNGSSFSADMTCSLYRASTTQNH